MVRPCSLLLVSLFLGCGPEAAPAPRTAPTPAASTLTPAPATPVVDPPKSTPEPAPVVVDDGPLGVAACDEYLAVYRACIGEFLPEDTRAAHTAVVDGQRRAWGRAKADAKTAGTLTDACTAARAAAKLALPVCKGG